MPGHGVAVAVAALVGKVPGEDDLPPSGRETRQRPSQHRPPGRTS